MSKASKIQKLLDYLQNNRHATREELANYLNVDKKTISSYINDINSDHHYYIHSETGKYGGYTLTNYNTIITIDESELGALHIAKEIIEKTRPEISLEFNALTKKIQKIYEKQSKEKRPLPNDYFKSAHGLSVHTTQDRKKERKINKAISEKRKILILYGDVYKNMKERFVDPYEIIGFKGSTYLVGHCHLRGEVRIFKLSRIESVKYTDCTFETNDTYDLPKIMASTLGIHIGMQINVKLKIKSPFDVIVSEKKWVNQQSITRIDEKLVLFEGIMSDDEETITWLLSLKDCVEIIEPTSLKERYLETLKKIYKKNFN